MHTELIDFRRETPYRPVNTFSHLRLADAGSLDAVLACLDALRQAQPDFRFLCTLDDLNQCCYTSMHASHDELLTVHDADVDYDDPQEVHAIEGRRLAHVMAQLDNPELRLDWQSAAGTLCTDVEDIEALVAMNAAPDDVIDDVLYVQRLPVPRDDLLIAGLPNGYFSADWSVFQNHALIRHLAAQYGYRFFGIGASWLGFVRDLPPDAAQADRLVADLAVLYEAGDEAQAAWRALAALLPTRRTLLLGYTENFAE